MSITDKIIKIQNNLKPFIDVQFNELQSLIKASKEFEISWSKSWIGYQSSVYYENFSPPPGGAFFSIEWGFLDGIVGSTRGIGWNTVQTM